MSTSSIVKMLETCSSITQCHSAKQEVLLLTTTNTNTPFEESLQKNNRNIIVRKYKSTATYWNLQGTLNIENPPTLKDRETRAYTIARSVFNDSKIVIPEVLHVDDKDNAVVFEYVGSSSSYFVGGDFDDSMVRNMIKTRLEFGFDEPHPRHGRVPAEQCLEYAKSVVRDIVVPIHKAKLNLGSYELEMFGAVKTFGGMLRLYEEQFTKLEGVGDEVMDMIEILKKNIRDVEAGCVGPTLVHGDLQPQNLMFRKGEGEGEEIDIACLLDWEDAAIADGRFEVLLIARKLVANVAQAKVVWSYYKELMGAVVAIDIGEIDDWLKLESLHSICTFMLQGDSSDKLGNELKRMRSMM